jgi:hypothetical protein
MDGHSFVSILSSVSYLNNFIMSLLSFYSKRLAKFFLESSSKKKFTIPDRYPIAFIEDVRYKIVQLRSFAKSLMNFSE